MRKIVLSAWITLDGYVAGPDNDKMEWLRGDAQMMEYEQSFVDAGKNIAMYGSLSVVRALSNLRLIDEYELLVHPNFVEKGKSLFEAPVDELNFKSAHPFRSGVVLMKYSVTADAADKKHHT